ncbi:MAG: hypothetical protein ACJ731_05580 [Vicinamibacterales bacterium]
MSVFVRAVLLIALGCVAAGSIACRGGIFGKQYEYEEDLYLSLDGTATVVVNSSLAALIALRGIDVDPNPSARLDLNRIRAAYQSPVTQVTRLTSWRRAGRRFVQVRMNVSDVRKLSDIAPFAWSRYTLVVQNGHHVFEQKVGASALKRGTLQNVGWNGSELVAFRFHLPSRILWHNSRDLDTNQTSDQKRGNILVWEQHLADRLDGMPLGIRVELESQSILHRTLWLFAGAFTAAIAVLALLIWLTMRKGAEEAATSS